MPVSFECPVVKQPTSCCSSLPETDLTQIKLVDKICRVALGAFALILMPGTFTASLICGVLAGAVYTIVRTQQNKPLFPSGESKPVCAQGYMDFLSGMRFPPIIGSLATTAFIGAHMRHDPLFYVPFCGFFIGFWLGREGASMNKDLGGYSFSKFYRSECCQSC